MLRTPEAVMQAFGRVKDNFEHKLSQWLAVAVVGGYGFVVWMYQLITGPPTY